MRHAKPVFDRAIADFNIPLAKEGIAAEKKLCLKLEKNGFFPQEVLSSPFQRARETGVIVAEHFGQKCQIVEALGDPFDEELLISWLKSTDADTIAFVGHGPSLTSMANHCLGDEVFGDIFPKSSAVVIAFEKEVQLRKGVLLDIFN